MSYAIIFSAGALADLRKTRKWYEEKVTGLGSRFSSAVNTQASKLSIRPTLYRKFHKNIHRCAVSGFPYAMYYKIDGQTVVVIAVHGSKQDLEGLLKKFNRNDPKTQA